MLLVTPPFGSIGIGLLDSTAPVPKMGELLGWDVKETWTFEQRTLKRRHRIRQNDPSRSSPDIDTHLTFWTCIVLRVIPTSTRCPTFSDNLGYSLEGLTRSFTPNWPNSKDDAMSARFLGSWIEQHVSPSAEQEMEHGVETRINRTLIAVHQLHSFGCLSSSSDLLVSDAERDESLSLQDIVSNKTLRYESREALFIFLNDERYSD
ncbi:hypothetical protein BLNAU_23117 [Blattamonas nauphoetae]|uniref:Uncharacterized protein n=1 Tax=Blattamonas nauphoetae TaxID=2049346 RepID=A0ABQ9WSA3_9EUKA|nr:hypothetical protein BLNAU_23117 [Blattamonas nauphoetae]